VRRVANPGHERWTAGGRARGRDGRGARRRSRCRRRRRSWRWSRCRGRSRRRRWSRCLLARSPTSSSLNLKYSGVSRRRRMTAAATTPRIRHPSMF
jgi:hypothetical protein